MPRFSKSSTEKLLTCHPRLQEILNEAIKVEDFVIICGHRNQADQDAAVAGGFSKTPWPNSKHNRKPSEAVDVAPYHKEKPHIHWNDIQGFTKLAGLILTIGRAKGVILDWGGDWVTFRDYPHIEIIGFKDPEGVA